MMHLVLDLYGCSPLLLADEQLLRSVLNAVPDLLGMQKAGAETLHYIDSVTNPYDAGHSGLILADNHMSLHAWPPYHMVNIDIFSRGDFDQELAITFLRDAFAAEDIEVQMVQRATRLPTPQQPGEKAHNQ